jgi:transcriptional regulator with XRE-family HTH domain
MAEYAGFKGLANYIEERCAREGITRSALAERLKWPRNYMHGIYNGLFRPSRLRAQKLARHFGDEDRLVLILCDLESAPSVVKDKIVAEVVDLYAALSAEQQAEARRYLKYLRDQPR